MCTTNLSYVYLLNCGSFRLLLLLLLIHANTRTVFRQATPTSSYGQQYRFILLSWSVLYEHENVVHKYTHTLAASSAAQHLLSRVCCVLSILSAPPSAHPDDQTAKRDGWLAYFNWYRTRTVVLFRNSLWLLPLPRYIPPPTGVLSFLRCGYEDNMQKTRSVTLLAPDA